MTIKFIVSNDFDRVKSALPPGKKTMDPKKKQIFKLIMKAIQQENDQRLKICVHRKMYRIPFNYIYKNCKLVMHAKISCFTANISENIFFFLKVCNGRSKLVKCNLSF